MPDPLLLLKALAAAAGVAVVVLLLAGLPWRAPHAGRLAAGGALGIGLAFAAGYLALGLAPHWPPADDQNRFLLLVLPAAVVAELVAAFRAVPRWLAWGLRLAVAAAVPRVLLHGSAYLAGDWTPEQTWQALSGLAAALAIVWAALVVLADRAGGRSVLPALAVCCAGAGGAVVLTGYASGGQLGLVLAAALAGTAVASLLVAGTPRAGGAAGVGVVGLFALVLTGRFFAELPTAAAALLFSAPLLAWLPELPPRLRGLARALLVAVPVGLAVYQAVRTTADKPAESASPDDPSADPYSNYGR